MPSKIEAINRVPKLAYRIFFPLCVEKICKSHGERADRIGIDDVLDITCARALGANKAAALVPYGAFVRRSLPACNDFIAAVLNWNGEVRVGVLRARRRLSSIG